MSMLKAKINAALAKIGNTNGTAPKESQDPIDALAHEYSVSSTMYSIVEKRKEMAKDALIKGLSEQAGERLASTKAAVKKSLVSDRVDLGEGQHCKITAKVNNGASYLDTDGIKVELLKVLGSEKTEELFAKHYKRRNPSVTYEVTFMEPD